MGCAASRPTKLEYEAREKAELASAPSSPQSSESSKDDAETSVAKPPGSKLSADPSGTGHVFLMSNVMATVAGDPSQAYEIHSAPESCAASVPPPALPMALPEAQTVGLKWTNVGAVAPTGGRELTNAKLSFALKRITDFTAEDLATYELAQLQPTDYIKSGGSYFQPAAQMGAMPAAVALPAHAVRSRQVSGEKSEVRSRQVSGDEMAAVRARLAAMKDEPERKKAVAFKYGDKSTHVKRTYASSASTKSEADSINQQIKRKLSEVEEKQTQQAKAQQAKPATLKRKLTSGLSERLSRCLLWAHAATPMRSPIDITLSRTPSMVRDCRHTSSGGNPGESNLRRSLFRSASTLGGVAKPATLKRKLTSGLSERLSRCFAVATRRHHTT